MNPFQVERRLRDTDRLVLWTALGMLAMAGVGLLRLRIGYWNDEAISIGIAARPLIHIPAALRHDGSPPLYYLLLHLWMRAAGRGASATHLFSLLAAVTAVPVMVWSATRLFGRRAGFLAGALTACNPYLWWYGTETRMYALVVLVAAVNVTCMAQVLRGQKGRWFLGAVVSATALVYLHTWGIYLVVGVTTSALGVACRPAAGGRRANRHLVATLALFPILVGALYLPWVPTLWFQLHHTGAPWASSPSLADGLAEPLQTVSGAAWWVLLGGGVVLAGRTLRHHRSSTDRGRPSRRGRGGDETVGWLWALTALTVVAAWVGARASGAWTPRYLAIVVAPLILALGGSLNQLATRTATAWLTTAVCVLVAGASLAQLVSPNGHGVQAKSNAVTLARHLRKFLKPGDAVIATQTSQVPLLAYYLGPSFRYGDPLGPVENVDYVDWINLPQRLARAVPTAAVTALISELHPGQHLVVIGPPTWPPATGYGATVRNDALDIETAAATSPLLLAPIYLAAPRTRYPLAATIFTRA